MRSWKKFVSVCLLASFLAACGGDSKPSRSTSVKRPDYSKDTMGLDLLTGQFSHNIDQIWGVNELLVASRKDYVKYTDQFYTRSHISFEDGKIEIETLGDRNHLRNAIIHTLLMGSDPSGIDLFASGDTPISNQPFLRGQVVDQYGRSITNIALANDFATYLLQNKLKNRRLKNGRTVSYVEIGMVANHVDVRARRYMPYIRHAARQYGIEEGLILAIMEIESSFNPYAVSHANAIGLMQVVPRTAGRDIFERKGFGGQPSRDYLYDPKQNIDAGTMYLAILKNEYLAGIGNPTSMRYAMISSYNGGAGAAMRVFDRDKYAAINRVNNLSPDAIYRILTTAHPAAESRNYLVKVERAYKKYRGTR
ncbi:murein transglycosylase C [Pasteurellaceae bacterium RH1A]|nr:murein transglycosylase C [Pasteurellaceae bacterium RH1A]